MEPLFVRGWGHKSLCLRGAASNPAAAPAPSSDLDDQVLLWLEGLAIDKSERKKSLGPDAVVSYPFASSSTAPPVSATALPLPAAPPLPSAPLPLAPSAPPLSPSEPRPSSPGIDDPLDGSVAYQWRTWSFSALKGQGGEVLLSLWTCSHLHPITAEPLAPFKAVELSSKSNGWVRYASANTSGGGKGAVVMEPRVLWGSNNLNTGNSSAGAEGSHPQDFKVPMWLPESRKRIKRTVKLEGGDGGALEPVLRALTSSAPASMTQLEAIDPKRGFVLAQNNQCRAVFLHTGEVVILRSSPVSMPSLSSLVPPLLTIEEIAEKKERALYLDPRCQYRWGHWAVVRTAESLVAFRHDKLAFHPSPVVTAAAPAVSMVTSATSARAGAGGGLNPFGPSPNPFDHPQPRHNTSTSTSTNPFDPSFKPSPSSSAAIAAPAAKSSLPPPCFCRGVPVEGFAAVELPLASNGWIKIATARTKGANVEIEVTTMAAGSGRRTAGAVFSWQPWVNNAEEARAEQQSAAAASSLHHDHQDGHDGFAAGEHWRTVRRVNTKDLTSLVLPQLVIGSRIFVPYASSRGVVFAQGSASGGCHTFLSADGLSFYSADGKDLELLRSMPPGTMHPPFFPHAPPAALEKAIEQAATEDSKRFGDGGLGSGCSVKIRTPTLEVMRRLFPFPVPVPPASSAPRSASPAGPGPSPSAPPAAVGTTVTATTPSPSAAAPSAAPPVDAAAAGAGTNSRSPAPSEVIVSPEMLMPSEDGDGSADGGGGNSPCCGICYETIPRAESKALLTPCGGSSGGGKGSGHFFCLPCLTRWIRTKILVPRHQRLRPNLDPLVDPAVAANAAVPACTFADLVSSRDPSLRLTPDDALSCPTCRHDFHLRSLAFLQAGLPFTSLRQLLEARENTLLVPSEGDLKAANYTALIHPSNVLHLCSALGLERSLVFLLAAGSPPVSLDAACAQLQKARQTAFLAPLPPLYQGGWKELWERLQKDKETLSSPLPPALANTEQGDNEKGKEEDGDEGDEEFIADWKSSTAVTATAAAPSAPSVDPAAASLPPSSSDSVDRRAERLLKSLEEAVNADDDAFVTAATGAVESLAAALTEGVVAMRRRHQPEGMKKAEVVALLGRLLTKSAAAGDNDSADDADDGDALINAVGKTLLLLGSK